MDRAEAQDSLPVAEPTDAPTATDENVGAPPGPREGEPIPVDALPSRVSVDDAPQAPVIEPEPPEPAGPFLGIGLRGGVSLNSDQLVAGLHLAVRQLFVPFLEMNVSVLVGLGSEYVSVRPALHIAAVLAVGSWRFYPLAGLSIFVFEPRGDFAEFCQKTGIDCDSTTVGPEAGLGVGFGPVGIEAILGLGDLPRLTLLAEITWMP